MSAAIEVWRVELDAVRAPSLELLDAAERARAARFLSDEPRARFVACRAALRAILARELGCDPRTLAFEEGVHGKPRLAGAHAGTLHFNVSHSSRHGLIALARGAPVGVDIELLRPLEEIERLAPRVLGDAQHARWLSLEPALRQREFYRHWTLKEAILKACGAGITQTLADVGPTSLERACEEPLDPARGPLEAPELLRDERGAPRPWHLFQMEAAPDACAALATQDPGRPRLALRTWR